MSAATTILWPAGYEPAGAAIHEVNRAGSAASADAVWAWLVRPVRWREYYGNALRIRHLAGAWPEVQLGTSFSWITFGVAVKTEITEYEPFERLAWTGSGLGSRGHHAWLLAPRPGGGTEIRTEETQRGTMSQLLKPVLAPAMRTMHQRWVDGLARVAESGRRP